MGTESQQHAQCDLVVVLLTPCSWLTCGLLLLSLLVCVCRRGQCGETEDIENEFPEILASFQAEYGDEELLYSQQHL